MAGRAAESAEGASVFVLRADGAARVDVQADGTAQFGAVHSLLCLITHIADGILVHNMKIFDVQDAHPQGGVERHHRHGEELKSKILEGPHVSEPNLTSNLTG